MQLADQFSEPDASEASGGHNGRSGREINLGKETGKSDASAAVEDDRAGLDDEGRH